MTQSLYERIGGEAAIAAAVDLFYAKVMEDELLRPFFDEVDLARLTKKQIAFMSHAFDGPAKYLGKNLREAHARLVRERGLTDVHFDRVAVHLDEALRELELSDELCAEIMGRVASLREQVLDR